MSVCAGDGNPAGHRSVKRGAVNDSGLDAAGIKRSILHLNKTVRINSIINFFGGFQVLSALFKVIVCYCMKDKIGMTGFVSISLWTAT